MGNQRQVVKELTKQELLTRIQVAKGRISELNTHLEVNKQNSLQAKEEIRHTADEIKDILMQRKKELIQEVERLHTTQARSLNDAVKATYVHLGSLQSMLTNLDSFDESQLMNLQLHSTHIDEDRTCGIIEPAEIRASLECEKIKAELKEWGSVTADGFQCCMATEEESGLTKFKKMIMMDYGTDRNSTSEIHCSTFNKENQERGETMTDARDKTENCVWNGRSIEEWLSRSSSGQMSNDSDDFLMVAPFTVDDVNCCVGLRKELEMDGSSSCLPRDDGETSSSIMCIEKDPDSKHDMSVWLKPKNKKAVLQCSSQQAPQFNSLELEDVSKVASPVQTFNGPTTGKRHLDFPCLRMDSDSWIRKKALKPSSSFNSQSSLSSGGVDLVPPAYALPNPFWLRK